MRQLERQQKILQKIQTVLNNARRLDTTVGADYGAYSKKSACVDAELNFICIE